MLTPREHRAARSQGWGDNTYDQLGDGQSGGNKDKPVKVKLPAHTIATGINAGGYSYHTLALVRRG
jgi:hypothetical protein